jgi:hypothetical protein
MIIILYILERTSSWSTSRICPLWPRSRVRLRLLLVLSPKYISCLLWPTQYRAVCSNSSYFALKPCLADWQLNTSVQVNNTTALHHIYSDTHIYITLISLFILFFTLLPPSLAGRLPQSLPVWHCKPWHVDGAEPLNPPLDLNMHIITKYLRKRHGLDISRFSESDSKLSDTRKTCISIRQAKH